MPPMLDKGKTGSSPAAADKPAGLDAFASEAAPPPADPAAAAKRAALVTRGLVALALLQAVPTVLWISNQLQPVSAEAVAAPAPAPPGLALATAPCEPAIVEEAIVAATPPPAEPARPALAAGLLGGMVSIATPLPMNIYRGDKLIGTTEAESLMLPLGTHDLEFVNDAVSYRTRRSITVQAARTTAVRLEVPRAPMHINALPWAEVWIDGQRVGETPLGNLLQPLGERQVVFRHPDLGERRMSVLVTAKGPARISVDLRKK